MQMQHPHSGVPANVIAHDFTTIIAVMQGALQCTLRLSIGQSQRKAGCLRLIQALFRMPE